MRDTFYLRGSEPDIRRLHEVAAADYTGRQFRLVVTDGAIDVRSEWTDGSRAFFTFVDLATLERSIVPECAPGRGADRVLLPRGIACVEHLFKKGRDAGVTFYVHPEDVRPGMLPERAGELSIDERLVLHYTATHKPSFAGITQYRKWLAERETGITELRWETAKALLIDKGLLTKIGGISRLGRNEVKR